MIIATGFYSGFLPYAPGTWGSLVGLAIYFLIKGLSLPTYCILIAVLLVVGFFAAGSVEKILDKKDPGPVVIDEIVGMLITMIAAPPGILPLIIGFLLFRVFDIMKPFPAGWLDRRIQGGVGIMLDDVVAGIYSFVVLQGLFRYVL